MQALLLLFTNTSFLQPDHRKWHEEKEEKGEEKQNGELASRKLEIHLIPPLAVRAQIVEEEKGRMVSKQRRSRTGKQWRSRTRIPDAFFGRWFKLL